MLFSIEGILRLGGYGCSPRFFLGRQITGRAVWTENPDFGRRFFPPGLMRQAQPFTIPAVKPSGTLRVFVLGESAAMGDPDFKFGLPRMLEVLLRERYPNRRVEVINAAVVAINSHVILPIVRDCAALQGDLWVIYMGNNEMIGPFGSATVFGARAPALPLVRAGLWLKTTRLGQLLDATRHFLRQGKPSLPEWSGMEMMADQKVRHDAPATATVYRHFERNLADILDVAARAGVPVILCTVPTNLKGCAPFASLHRAGLAEAELSAWQKEYDAGVAWQGKGNLAEANAAYERAGRIDDQFAELAFRHGECFRQLGKDTEAAKCFRQARDLDALQFRADGQINEIIRRAGTAVALASPQARRPALASGVNLLDAEKLAETNSAQGSAGAEMFYEHVHLTPEGNYFLALEVAQKAAAALSLESGDQWVSQSECHRLLGLTDWNRYDAFNTILDRIQHAPFISQADHTRQLERIEEQLARYRLATKPAQVKRQAALVAPLVTRHPEDADLRWNVAELLESAGDKAGAEEQWRALMRLQPQAVLPRYNLAKLLDGIERQTEAAALYLDCLRLNPAHYQAHYALGSVYWRMGRWAEAVEQLKLAVGQKPGSIEARLALGEALARSGQPARAEREWREVLRLEPGNERAQKELRGR